ncbi:aerotaxis receptor [Oceanospirillum multiglobuliferum]|uniref:Aerotaxis receptor Aer n=1 Tax=Oceanospirillum multiglobuliferum TaxID=64969 RepID=A0A1T4PTK9_9GAMM|nr:PAS domain-containing protein [Oceanospirillum multiglobuliferum]OPX55322.1 aerotaxis receptor Aer [Oceanospirillum multiglobuliferum]SJZ94895.1 aerotaxis receptor [Oceanospirillum multiglobuliferum]
MLAHNIYKNSQEILLEADDLIISKTDTRGHITYANRTFLRIADYQEEEVLNKPHNLIRHPDMPRGVFRFLWQELRKGHEFFGFVKNYTSGGDYYWVFANITPDFDASGHLKGYFSVRRRPSRAAIDTLIPIYNTMLEIESRANSQSAADHSLAYLVQLLESKSVSYDRFVMTLQAM